MPQARSQTPSHSPPHSTFVPTYEVIVTPTLNPGFSTPPPPPHAYDVAKDIHHHKSKEDEFFGVIAPTSKPL